MDNANTLTYFPLFLAIAGCCRIQYDLGINKQ